jgi:hypothetical protein
MENEDECTIFYVFLGIFSLQSFLFLDMIHESAPITNTFVSVPSDMGQLNCACFIGGIIAGALESSRFVRILFFPPFLTEFNFLFWHRMHE